MAGYTKIKDRGALSVHDASIYIDAEGDDVAEGVPKVCDGAASFCGMFWCCCTFAVIFPLICWLALTGPTRAETVLRYVSLVCLLIGLLIVIWNVVTVCTKGICCKPPAPPKACALLRGAIDHGTTQRVKSLAVIVNPKAGVTTGKSNLEICQEIWKAGGIAVRVLETERAGHAREMGRDMELRGLDALCIIGGDGSFHELVNGLLARRDGQSITIGLIPGGSGNSVMCDLGTWDVREAAERVVRGEVHQMDVNVLETCGESIISVHEVSVGMVGDVGIMAEGFRCLGPARYDACAVWCILKGFKQKVIIEIVDADGDRVTKTDEYMSCFANLTQHFGKGLRAAPDARIDDDLIDLVLIKAGQVGRAEMLALLQQLPSGAHASSDIADFIQCKEVSFEFDGPGAVNVDGEMCRHDGRLRLRSVPRRIALFMDAESLAGEV